MKRISRHALLALCAVTSACQSAQAPNVPGTVADQTVVSTTAVTKAEPTRAAFSEHLTGAATLLGVHKGMAYADFRSALLGDGWRPMPDLQCKAHVVGGAYKELCAKGSDACNACNELPELTACSGDAVCMMRFQDAGSKRQLEVSTYGDIQDRAVHGTDSQLGVTGWTVSSSVSH